MIQRRSFISGLVASVVALFCGRKVDASQKWDAALDSFVRDDHKYAPNLPRIMPGRTVRQVRKIVDYKLLPCPSNHLMTVEGNPSRTINGVRYVDYTHVICRWYDGRRYYDVAELEVVDVGV